MTSLTKFVSSPIGSKTLMGVTGLIWSGFLLGHMAGNLLIFLGPEAYNNYSNAIVTNPLLLYGTEVILLLSLLVHVFRGIVLTWQNRKARPVGYAVSANGAKKTSVASKTLAYQGVVILVFIILHLITFKYGSYYEYTNSHGVQERDLFRLIVEVFHNPVYVVWYFVALLLLSLHLGHGLYSSFQSLGLNHPGYVPLLRKGGYAFATVVTIGFLSQPFYVYFIHGTRG